jgi:hypothetical protein
MGVGHSGNSNSKTLMDDLPKKYCGRALVNSWYNTTTGTYIIQDFNRIDGVMVVVSVLVSSAVDRGFEPRSG